MGSAGRELDEMLAALVEWSNRSARTVKGISQAGFLQTEILQLAATRCVEGFGAVAGEMLNRHPQFAASHPELELAEAYRTRNRFAHGYETLEMEVVWRAITLDIPRAADQARRLLDENGKPASDP